MVIRKNAGLYHKHSTRFGRSAIARLIKLHPLLKLQVVQWHLFGSKEENGVLYDLTHSSLSTLTVPL